MEALNILQVMCSTGTPAINFIKPYKICGLLALKREPVRSITHNGTGVNYVPSSFSKQS